MAAAVSIRVAIGILACCLGFPASPAYALPQQAKDDVVTLEDKSTESGKVVAENYDALELELKRGVKKKIEWGKIASVQFATVPLEYTEAMDARASDPEGALGKLKAVAGQEGLGDVLRQQSMMEVAALQQRLGAFGDAITSWNSLIAAFPEGRYLGVAARGLVDALLAQQDAAGASKTLDTLGAHPAVGKFEVLGIEIKALRGRILMAQGKYADARAAFEQVEKEAKASADVKAVAKLGAAESLKQEGKLGDAETRFKAIVEGEGPNFLLAGAWNGLGDLLSKKGFDASNADVLTEALYAYLRGVVQYVPAAGEPQDEYERALGGSAKCFKLLSQLEKSKERKADYETKFTQQAERLRRLFPNSNYLTF